MRFSVAFWHTFRGTGGDPFGAATKYWPWEDGTNSLAMAKRRSKTSSISPIFWTLALISVQVEVMSFYLFMRKTVKANFEFINKIGVDWWCFHDRDIAPDGNTLEVSLL
jgi:xylose isomerase